MVEINNNKVRITGRIDSNNAKQFEDELFAAVDLNNPVLDASELEYISSAGLRVLLKLKKSTSSAVSVINVNSEIYDIFTVTGFDSILEIKKALRNVDVSGCEIIGQGGNGTVYRLDDDTIVKVYKPNVSLEKIEMERSFAKTALVNGIPCVITYDVVKCGDSYGIVFELLKSDTLGHAISNNPDRYDEYVDKYVALAKELHGANLNDSTFTTIKSVLHDRVPNLKKWCSDEEVALVDSLVDELPDDGSIIHGDLHPGNIMIQDGELLLIDMPEVTVGAKIWDLTGIYRDLISALQAPDPSVKALLEKSTGMSGELLKKTGYEFFTRYTGITDKKELETYFKKLGLVYALNVVLVLAGGSAKAVQRAEPIIQKLLRETIIPNEQTLRSFLKNS